MRSCLLALTALALACQPPPAPQRTIDCPNLPPAVPAAQAPPPPPPPPERFDPAAIDAYVAAQVEQKGFVGLSLAIVRDGEVVLARGYGKRSLTTGAPVDPDTAFAIGSVSKQFTCAAALLLAEDGRLSLNDSVAKYYPDLTRASDITIDHLLSHTSGYPDYYPLDFVDDRMSRPIDPDELIKRYAGAALDFDPGTRYSYSNTGFVIVGRVVEKLSGTSFAEFLQQRIFTPVGMKRAAFAPPADAPGLAAGYTTFSLGPPIPAPPEASGWVHAAGALVMTPTDLARWDLALMQGTLFKQPDTLRAMTTPRKLSNGEPIDYACGLSVGRRQGETLLQHSGAVSGFLAWNAMIPRTRSALILVTNADYVDGGGLYNELLGLLIDADKPIPAVPGDSPRDVALALVRQYQSGKVDRAALGDAFNNFLTDDKLREAAPRLAALGDPSAIVVERLGERGGMQVAALRLHFPTRSARALLYRTPDGKIQEFLILSD
jgi:D-alanyl-D-alanine carboxypeptidase